MSFDAERAVITTVLLHADTFRDAARQLVEADFASAGHRALWAILGQLHAHGEPDVPLVLDAIGERADLRDTVLDALTAPPAAIGLLDRHITAVLSSAAHRRLVDVSATLAADLLADDDLERIIARTHTALDRVAIPNGPLPGDYLTAKDVEDLAAETPARWTVPNLLRRAARMVIVAEEGAGKSVLGRQLAVASACGWHPFGCTRIHRIKTLIVDLENDHRAVHRADGKVEPTSLAALIATGRLLSPGWNPNRWLRLWTRPSGVDLRERSDLQAFRAILEDFRPELVVAGPVYRMGSRLTRENDEDLARALTGTLDDLRAQYSFAVILEAHAPHGFDGSRPLRPIGSSTYLRWPDLGRSLAVAKRRPQVLTVGRFRGDRCVVHWPDELARTVGSVSPWPWAGMYTDPPPTISAVPEPPPDEDDDRSTP